MINSIMKVNGMKLLNDFSQRHSLARGPIRAWLAEAKTAKWQSSQDVKERYSTASFLANNIVVFNLGGNKYRLEARIAYEFEIVLVKRIGTHAEYSRWK